MIFKMYKFILFDLGGVLFTNGTKKFISNLSTRYNIPLIKIQEIIDGNIGTQYREGKIGRDEFWRKVIGLLNLKEDANLLEKEWIDGYKLIEGTKDIILSLKGKFKLFYLSDNVEERVQKLNDKFGFLRWFDGGIFSHNLGIRKPNPLIYKAALEKANTIPAEAIFIDDKPHFLIPAKEMGITTIWFESPEKLKKKLQQLNIKI